MTQSYSTYLSSKKDRPVDVLRQAVFRFESHRGDISELVGVVTKFDKFGDRPAIATIEIVQDDIDLTTPSVGSKCIPAGIYTGSAYFTVRSVDVFVSEPCDGFSKVSITVEASHQSQPKAEFEVLDF
jgi:hypothetical protein